MKHCTTCQLEYTDEMLRFCRIDGTSLAPTVFPETAATLVFSPSRRNLEKFSPLSSAESIAVLPFVNMSAEPENEFFCDGLAEELTNALAKLGQLRVAARTSSFSFKRKDNTVGDIGRALNVSTILEGSVRKIGNRLRITAQLINVTDGYHIWSERYDRQLEDVFDVQDQISLAIVDALNPRAVNFNIALEGLMFSTIAIVVVVQLIVLILALPA